MNKNQILRTFGMALSRYSIEVPTPVELLNVFYEVCSINGNYDKENAKLWGWAADGILEVIQNLDCEGTEHVV